MKPNHRFKLIVFDLDGTLVDSQAGIVAAMSSAFEAHGLAPPPAEAVRRVVGLSLHEAMTRLLPEPVEEWHVESLVRGYRTAFAEVLRNPDYEEPLFPGAREAIAALDYPEVCLGIATGKSRRGVERTLALHALRQYFVTVQTADRGPGKPHPRMLRDAMAETGVAEHETVLIGDTVFDIEMAGNAGTAALGVSWGYHDVEELRAAGAHAILDGFDRLSSTLELLEGGSA